MLKYIINNDSIIMTFQKFVDIFTNYLHFFKFFFFLGPKVKKKKWKSRKLKLIKKKL